MSEKEKEKQQNYLYEIVFRTKYLDEDCDEIEAKTEVILFRQISGNFLCVNNNMDYLERHYDGTTMFRLDFRVPEEKVMTNDEYFNQRQKDA